ncbi:MAG: nucleotidyltransferase family protein [Allorhizobium sp.]
MKYFDVAKASISQEMPMRKAIEVIDSSGLKIAIVITDETKLIGIVTDGDIRRALLAGRNLDTPVKEFMRTNPRTALWGTERSVLLGRLRHEQILHLPIVDETGVLRDLAYLPAYEQRSHPENQVVIMAGGLGTRLRPLTDNIPKPLISVAGRPLIDTIIDNLVSQGLTNITLCVNYLGHMLEDHLGDGVKLGAQLTYVREEQRMGTAGALSLLPNKPTSSFFVMNGDILTTVDFQAMLDFHRSSSVVASMAVNNFTYEVPFGVVEASGHHLSALSEKPKHSYLVNAGIYLLEPEVLGHVPDNQFYDMTSLFERLLEHKLAAAVFPVREQWLDIGRPEDLVRANDGFEEIVPGN